MFTARLAFCTCPSYENYVVKQKKDKDKDNVVEFSPSSEEPGAPAGPEELSESEDKGESASGEPAGEEAAPDELELLRREKDNYYDLMLRKQAELENYRKRVAREKQEAVNLARIGVLQGILPVVDACEKGIENLRKEEGDDLLGSYTEGYEMLLRQLKSLLESNQVSEVSGVGSIFDPNVHEAVLREVSDDHEDGEVLEEYRRGYTMNDQLLRAAQVKVAVHPD